MKFKKRKGGSDPVDVHVGTQVRMRRLMLAMSQTVLAQQVGLTFQQIQKYEKGKNRISSSRLLEFATILNTPVASFFEDAANVKQGDKRQIAIDEFFATNDGLLLAKSFMQIKDLRTRQRLIGLVEDLAAND